ncbi:MAG: metalloregulator ArsR/SmtB family transcription factor [Synergistaceae bacterium]|nr:metalloregulator ArsR/SmtB family transcription factor [Synergistaceae bacterium]
MNIQDVCPEHIINEYSRKLKVCGHPLRIKLLCAISLQNGPCVTNLWTSIGGESQPVISQHLAVLKEHGIVDSVIQGNRRIYSIKDSFIRDLVARMLEDTGRPSVT